LSDSLIFGCSALILKRTIKNDRGLVLVSAALMLTALVSVVLVCFFVLGHGAGNDLRYQATRRRMHDVKRALLGRLADARGGKDITACGGFVSDYGEPDDMTPFAPGTDNFVGVLLNRQSVAAWQGWSYSGSPEQFWAGYRSDRYLTPSPGEWSDDPPFPHDLRDGWGYPIEVKFIQDSTPEHTVIEIKSHGSDGLTGGGGNYKEDVEEAFYWKRSLHVIFQLDATGLGLPDGTDVDVEARTVYPFRGNVATKDQTVTITVNSGIGSGVYDFPIAPPGNMDPTKFPVGSRKIIWTLKTDLSPWGGPTADTLLATRMVLIPASPVTSSPPGPPRTYSISMQVTI